MGESWGILVGSAVVLGALIGPAAGLVVGWLVLISQIARGSLRWVPFAVVLAGVLVGAGRAALVHDDPVPIALASSTGAEGVVETMPASSGDRLAFHLRVDALTVDGETARVSSFTTRVTVDAATEVTKGDRVRVSWTAGDLTAVSPGYSGYLSAQGVSATAWAWNVEVEDEGPWLFAMVQDVRARIGDGFSDLMPGDAGALATGIVTGDDSGLSDTAEEAFLRTGTSHITAVSGSNVAMVLAVWNLAIPAGRRRRLLAVQVAVVVSIWGYALLTGLEPPATRAATMASLMLFGSRFGRRSDAMTLLALTSAAMVLWNPRNVEMVSFWLSVVATAAIVSRVPADSEPGWGRVARGVFEGTVLAQIATLPLVLMTFGSWSLVSVLANLVLAPLIWVAFPLCFLLAALVVVAPVLAPLLSWLPSIVLSVCLAIVQDLGDVMPVVSIEGAGLAGALAIGLPCLIALLVLGKDGQRWLASIRLAGKENMTWLIVLGAGPAVGLLVATLMILVRG